MSVNLDGIGFVINSHGAKGTGAIRTHSDYSLNVRDKLILENLPCTLRAGVPAFAGPHVYMTGFSAYYDHTVTAYSHILAGHQPNPKRILKGQTLAALSCFFNVHAGCGTKALEDGEDVSVSVGIGITSIKISPFEDKAATVSSQLVILETWAPLMA